MLVIRSLYIELTISYLVYYAVWLYYIYVQLLYYSLIKQTDINMKTKRFGFKTKLPSKAELQFVASVPARWWFVIFESLLGTSSSVWWIRSSCAPKKPNAFRVHETFPLPFGPPRLVLQQFFSGLFGPPRTTSFWYFAASPLLNLGGSRIWFFGIVNFGFWDAQIWFFGRFDLVFWGSKNQISLAKILGARLQKYQKRLMKEN